MSEKNNIPSVSEVATWKPAEVQAWLDSLLSSRDELLKHFNWVLLAYVTSNLARSSDDLEWARVALRIYNVFDRRDECGPMWLRAYLINKRGGGVSGDPVLDPNVILEWFYESLSMSFTEAELGIRKWKEMIAKFDRKPADIQLIGELRRIKNRLSIIEFLVEGDTLHPDEELSKWLHIRASLP
jgi:hypothetical protein